MSEKYIFTILGGDRRQAVVAARLLDLGHTVRIYGLGELSARLCGAEIFSSVDKAVFGCDALILPLPVSRDNINLYFAMSPTSQTVSLKDILNNASKSGCQVVLGGMIPDEALRQAQTLGLSAYDYYSSPDLQRKNALPSAEGALMIAMEHTDITVKGMKALVCGYGRIGSCLAAILDKLGAEVTVAARGDGALCEASLCGYGAVRIDPSDTQGLADAANLCDVIFNTVPSVIFNEQVLNGIRRKPLYIEVASSPGGIDVAEARQAGMQIIFAPSLPGRYAPRSAGEYIFETLSDILKKIGMEVDCEGS